MNFTAEYISYRQTKRFSNLVLDYIEGDSLKKFISGSPDTDGISKAIENKNTFPHRELLFKKLSTQYKHERSDDKVIQNISRLRDSNTFSVCTAHQPNIFTGPLYFIYKIAHTIRLAEYLGEIFPGSYFVPVFYMGSEDADLDELGNISVGGKVYHWQTKQKGAVGRMKVDDALLKLVTELKAQVSVLPYGEEIISQLQEAYVKGVTIEQATFRLIDSLFGKYGLVVLLPDDKLLKQEFAGVIEKELTEQFSQKAVNETVSEFPKEYKVQAAGREINLFYLDGEVRERIVDNGNGYAINNSGITFSKDEMFQHLVEHPERFSPNVILRPVYQEMILPNIAFIGGGGELAYWLELKEVFNAANIPMPVLVLRNSFMVLQQSQQKILHRYNLKASEIFDPLNELLKKVIQKETGSKFQLTGEIESLSNVYDQLKTKAAEADVTLYDHVGALEKEAIKKIQNLEKKIFRALKRKNEAVERQLTKLLSELFPAGSLQERNHNLVDYYARFGPAFIDKVIYFSGAFEQEFTILTAE